MNRKKTQRLYGEEGLAVRRRARPQSAAGRARRSRAGGPNSRWSIDFVHDQLANGRRFRVLTIIDDVTKECLAAVPDTSISGKRVVREMSALIARRGRPGAIVSDNGTEFTSSAVLAFTTRRPGRLALHRAGQADAERLRRELSRADAGRVPQRDPLLLDQPRPRRVARWVADFNSAGPIRRSAT